MKASPAASLLLLGLAVTCSADITIETVLVGNPGNPNDTIADAYGNYHGAVSYTYAIGKYEVTLNQYAAFLNSVATTADPYNLWTSPLEFDDYSNGIARNGSLGGPYTYSVLGNGARPVTFVSWFSAARFMNWLHNGQPNTGAETTATTERGAYTLDGAMFGLGYFKNPDAKFWIPSDDEWYKAAYYQPASAGGDADGYWLYPMQTNSVPFSDQPPGTTPDNTRNANFYKDDLVANGYDNGYAVHTGSGNALTPVGAYTASDSYYGTFDQGGNVAEWTDALILIDSARGLRGGEWSEDEEFLRASTLSGGGPTSETRTIGFRIATIPEPTVASSLILSSALLLARRKRAR